MVILFKPYFMDAIRNRDKTQTRRNHKVRRWKIGSLQQCRTLLFGHPFAIVRIKNEWQERVNQITPAGVRAEGFTGKARLPVLTPAQFVKGFLKIAAGHVTPKSLIWVYEFELVKDCGEEFLDWLMKKGTTKGDYGKFGE
jgi:hypothetical protein